MSTEEEKTRVNEVEEIHSSEDLISEEKQSSSEQKPEETKTKNFYNILENGLPFKKELGESVVTLAGISKSYTIKGRTESVTALKQIDLNDDSEFYSIKRGEFLMIRGPSGGGKT